MTQFATNTDYYAYQGLEVPTLDDAEVLALDSLLQRATDRIIRITRTARYYLDADGLPTPAAVREAFRRATSAQAIAMRAGGEEGDGGASADDWNQVELIGVKFARPSGDASAAATVTIDGTRYSSEAIDILVGAGLFSSRVAHPGA